MARGLLTAGKKNKEEMVKELCIVGQVPGLPSQLARSIGKTTLSVEDPAWDATMIKLAMFGKPAFGKSVYTDQRTTAKHDAKIQAVFEANKAYIEKAKELFSVKFKNISETLPKRLEDAIAYAYQEDGFLANKTYPAIPKPAVWTPIAKERYDDQQRQRTQKIAWDKIIQRNIDWFFAITTKGNTLTSVVQIDTPDQVMNERYIEKVSTVRATFRNGKTLELDFVIRSKELPRTVFSSLADIKKEADSVRGSAIAGSREARKPIALPDDIDVYSMAEKMANFFSPFREKSMGDTYRYQ